MTRLNKAIFTLLIMAFTPAGIAQSADPIEELKDCARMTDRDARYACFDDLGQRVLGEGPAVKEPPQEEVAQPAPETMAPATEADSLPDDLGASEPKTISYSGTVTSCEKGHYGDWYFIFVNGQVWKEANKRNLRFRECNFDVTITKDAFGYKMEIDALKRSIRVRRHK